MTAPGDGLLRVFKDGDQICVVVGLKSEVVRFNLRKEQRDKLVEALLHPRPEEELIELWKDEEEEIDGG